MAEEIIRPSEPSDIPELQRLFTEVFGTERDPRIWRWKYFEHPRGPHSFVVESGGRLVAHCGGTAVTMLDGDGHYDALQSVDFMSTRLHPGGMGRGGVFARMVASFFAAYCGPRHAEMVYGFPGERHRVLGERILGYRPVEPVGRYTAPPHRRGNVSGQPFDRDTSSRFRAPRIEMGTERSGDYVNWRYVDHPLHTYLLVEVNRWPWQEPASAIVREDEDRLLVLEWGGADDDRTRRRLARRIRQMGRNVHGWGSVHGSMARLLGEEGWEIVRRDHQLEMRSFTNRSVPHPGEMYYSLGDYDVD